MKPRTKNAQPIPPAMPVAITEVPANEADRIEWYRRCPICWERCKGVGLQYSTQGSTRYYKCSKTLTELPPCAHTWTAIVKTEVIRVEHRIITVEHR